MTDRLAEIEGRAIKIEGNRVEWLSGANRLVHEQDWIELLAIARRAMEREEQNRIDAEIAETASKRWQERAERAEADYKSSAQSAIDLGSYWEMRAAKLRGQRDAARAEAASLRKGIKDTWNYVVALPDQTPQRKPAMEIMRAALAGESVGADGNARDGARTSSGQNEKATETRAPIVVDSAPAKRTDRPASGTCPSHAPSNIKCRLDEGHEVEHTAIVNYNWEYGVTPVEPAPAPPEECLGQYAYRVNCHGGYIRALIHCPACPSKGAV